MKIAIEGLNQQLRLGVGEEERSTPQSVELSIRADLTGEAMLASDDVRDTVDYVEIVSAISRMSEEQEWKLLEKYCSDICCELLFAFPLLSEVEVVAKKRIFPEIDAFVCGLTRKREDIGS